MIFHYNFLLERSVLFVSCPSANLLKTFLELSQLQNRTKQVPLELFVFFKHLIDTCCVTSNAPPNVNPSGRFRQIDASCAHGKCLVRALHPTLQAAVLAKHRLPTGHGRKTSNGGKYDSPAPSVREGSTNPLEMSSVRARLM